MRSTLAIVLLSTALAACGSDVEPIEMLDGFEPPAPAAGELQFISPIVRDIPAGADSTLCTYLPTDVSLDEAVDVIKARGFQSNLAGHHAILYMAERERPVDTHECTDDDMVNARFLAGAGGGDAGGAYADIPDGLAYRVDAGRQLMIQSHWINTGTSPVDGQAAFNIAVQPPSDQVQLANLFNWTTTQIAIPAGELGSASSRCTVEQDLNFYLVGGHAHEHGTRVRLTHTPAGGEATTFYDEDWVAYYAFDPPRMDLGAIDPMVIRAGDTLGVDCEYDNTTTGELAFPSEMCVGFGFYFPAVSQLDCVDGRWPE